ncbi:MAG: EamA family transporter [Thiothrix sp.]|nr:MAG: EamA family transporter [Thiothrix sp.]
MSSVNRATAIGFISIVLWGMLALLTSLSNGKIPPFQMLAMTFALAFLLMLGNWLRQGKTGLEYIHQPLLAWLLGVGGLFGYHFFYFLAMAHAPVVEVSLIAYLWPLLIVLLSALLPGEHLSKFHLIGAVLALAGCWVLIGGGSKGFSPDYLTGYLAALACALLWSTYSVASRLVKQVPTDAVAWFCGVTALLGLICHLVWETTIWPANGIEWLGVIGLGLGPVGIAFFTWDYGVKHGNLQLLGVLSYAAPLISVLVLILAGKAEPSLTILFACLAIVGGAFIAGQANKFKKLSSL